jgi:hypothetical protein
MSDKQTAVESLKDFFKQYDLAHSSLDYYEFKIPMHIFDKKFEEAKEIEKDQMDAEIIKICAEKSTSESYKYADGYSQGWEAALKMVKWKIDNELRTNNNEQ